MEVFKGVRLSWTDTIYEEYHSDYSAVPTKFSFESSDN